MTVLVIGVGYLGRRLLDVLPKAETTGLSRSARDPAQRLDLDRGDALPMSLVDPYAVVYTVPPAQSDVDAPDPRLATLLAMLAPAPQRFVYISTTGVYGDHGGGLVTEATPLNPQTERAQRRVGAERMLTAWCRERDVALVILRVPGIYGPGRLGVERVRTGAAVLAEADANPGNRIHVDDLARCCTQALSADVPAGIYNVGDGDERSSTWFASELARQLDLPAPPTISREQARGSFSPRRMSFLDESRRVDTARMREVLGVIPTYADASAGIAASLAEEAES